MAHSWEGPAHELAAALLWRSHGVVGPARAAGDLVAAQAHTAQAAVRNVSAAEDPRSRAEARGNAAGEPVVADAAAAVDGSPCRRGISRTRFQSPRKIAG